MAKRYELTDQQFAVIRDLLPGKPGDPRADQAQKLVAVDFQVAPASTIKVEESPPAAVAR